MLKNKMRKYYIYNMKYICDTCEFCTDHKKTYDRHIGTKKHLEKINDGSKYICTYCNNNFSSTTNLLRHESTCSIRKILIGNLQNEIYQG